jgi:hypothetical protein
MELFLQADEKLTIFNFCEGIILKTYEPGCNFNVLIMQALSFLRT